MESFKNANGKSVQIEKLEDRQLIDLYRFFMDYTKRIIAISKENKIVDSKYLEFSIDMVEIKNALKAEIKKRKLIIRSFDK